MTRFHYGYNNEQNTHWQVVLYNICCNNSLKTEPLCRSRLYMAWVLYYEVHMWDNVLPIALLSLCPTVVQVATHRTATLSYL